MKNKITNWSLILLILLFSTCIGEDIDDEYPEIDLTAADAFPQFCDTVYRGESFTFKVTFTDNVELGAYSIDIHNNFDHHTHSTSIVECDLDDIKTEVDPFIFLEEYEIPEGQVGYTTDISIEVPNSIDTGDYHFMIRLSDTEGWQTTEGISIKILDRER